MEFSQFCSCGPSGYARLKQQVDACARLGRSYEFPACRLPAGCWPEEAQVGFWRCEEDYLLYFRPPVAYTGTDSQLTCFFRRGAVQRYAGFQAMTDSLRALDSALTAPKPDLFQALKDELQRQVLGQEAAVEAAAFKLCGHICKREPRRPLSLIFYGPTGVGKSELGKAVAPALNACLGEERCHLVWTELNTFTQAHSVYRLTGAPPGYVGYGDPSILEEVRRCPDIVFMFDELDKAHPEVLKALMSVLDEGRCAARREGENGARELDFRRCIFLFTTNLDLSATERTLGFSPPREKRQACPLDVLGGLAGRLYRADESARLALARSGVLQEIAGRFSGLIGFQPLDEQARLAVTAKQIAALGREYGLNVIQVDPAIARALTPREAISPRSTVPVLEGVLTPLFLTGKTGKALRLAGTVERMVLVPA